MRVGYGKPKNETVGPSAKYKHGPNCSSISGRVTALTVFVYKRVSAEGSCAEC
jgi:hypothetical protein